MLSVLKSNFHRFAQDESGATVIEYGMIAALISISLIGVIPGIATELKGTFGDVKDGLGKR
jgi:pilus assembly protein Flp/PilA